MTFRMLYEKMRQFVADNSEHEALDQRVVMRLSVNDGDDLHVGGLDSLSVDAGCTDTFALVMDGSDSPDPDED